MRFTKKNNILTSAFTQMFLVIVAFAIMGVSSFLFVCNTENKQLISVSQNSISLAEKNIISPLKEIETLLNNYSETLRSMVLFGFDNVATSNYMAYITGATLNDTTRMENVFNTHGYFFTWDGKYISGKNINLPIDFIPQNQRWYTAAIEADGNIAASLANTNASAFASASRNSMLTFSRLIKYSNNNPIGVVCIDVEMNNYFDAIIRKNLTENSYGLLLNNNLDIIAHPQSALVNRNLINVNKDIAGLVSDLEDGVSICEVKVKNYMGKDSIVYINKIDYDWYLGIVIPAQEYYKNRNNLAAFMVLLGLLLATALCVMFYRIFKAKLKSDMQTQQKSNFLATISHEIRTPLNAILGMTEIQMQNSGHPPLTSDAFIKINNSGNLLLSIINDILDLSKIEAGKLDLLPVKYEVKNLIFDIVQLNYIRYESKPIEFDLVIDENIPSILIGDDLRIKQILNNLLSNAFKYTDKGTVTLSVNAECISRGGIVLVTLIFQIKDTGQGMTPDQVNKLFDEYSRFNQEANRTAEGAGLGMTITRNLVELMYGKIFVKSAVGEGTTVTVRLPQKTDGFGIGGVIGKEMAEKIKQGNILHIKKCFVHEYMPYGRILIVDDVETNLFVARGLMEPYGLEIDLAKSGFDAIDKIKNGKIYDIVFMDHMMPKMDGIKTTHHLREMGYTRPIVALTANALLGQEEVFLQNGFDGYISKPIDIRHLNVILNRLIRDKQSSEVVEASQKEKSEMEKKQGGKAIQKQLDSQLAAIFSRDAEKAVSVLKNCLAKKLDNEDDIQMFIINVHSMKSALANIGEVELSSIALRLEQAARERKTSVILFESKTFIDNLCKVIEKIKPQDDSEAHEDTEESLIYLREKLEIIKKACTELDKKTAKNTINELREKTLSQSAKDLINKLSEHLLHSEFDDAATLIEKNLP